MTVLGVERRDGIWREPAPLRSLAGRRLAVVRRSAAQRDPGRVGPGRTAERPSIRSACRRLLTVSGMAAALVGLLALSLAHENGWLTLATISLVLFGIGQGLFTAPNNSAIMTSAAAGQSGQAGGVLFVMRSLGMSLGISLASIILAWQFPVLPGRTQAAVGIPAHLLVQGAVASFTLFAALAGIAALLCFVRAEPDAPADGQMSFVKIAE